MTKYDTSVYFLTSTRNDAEIRYIGITNEPLKKRLKRHVWDCISRKKTSSCLRCKWIKKEIEDGFDIEIHLIVSSLIFSHACRVEMDLIKESKDIGLRLVNTTNGGDGYRGKHTKEHNNKKGRKGLKRSIQTRLKMSKSAKGKILSKETKLKISLATKGRVTSEETKLKIRLAHIGKKMQYSEEGRLSLIKANTGRVKTTQEIKKRLDKTMVPIIQLDLNSNFIKEWSCSKYAYNELKIDPSSITAVCRGRRKTAGGFKWKYKNKK